MPHHKASLVPLLPPPWAGPGEILRAQESSPFSPCRVKPIFSRCLQGSLTSPTQHQLSVVWSQIFLPRGHPPPVLHHLPTLFLMNSSPSSLPGCPHTCSPWLSSLLWLYLAPTQFLPHPFPANFPRRHITFASPPSSEYKAGHRCTR